MICLRYLSAFFYMGIMRVIRGICHNEGASVLKRQTQSCPIAAVELGIGGWLELVSKQTALIRRFAYKVLSLTVKECCCMMLWLPVT